ncbi:MAG: hypothetical protein V3T17_04295 [Pseudomonadales bacterium]
MKQEEIIINYEAYEDSGDKIVCSQMAEFKFVEGKRFNLSRPFTDKENIYLLDCRLHATFTESYIGSYLLCPLDIYDKDIYEKRCFTDCSRNDDTGLVITIRKKEYVLEKAIKLKARLPESCSSVTEEQILDHHADNATSGWRALGYKGVKPEWHFLKRKPLKI